jgi:hypothetical protein
MPRDREHHEPGRHWLPDFVKDGNSFVLSRELSIDVLINYALTDHGGW